MEELLGKVVLVTGGSRGIGRAIAIKLGSLGASVVINYSKDDDGANSTLEQIRKNGGYSKLIKKDISNYENSIEVVKEVIDTFGKIDILINNAAISEVGLFMDIEQKDMEKLINTNLLAPMNLSKAALLYMIPKGKGNIINISSIWGDVGASCEVVYSTTKGGINLFTKSLAKEVAPFGVRVNAIAPGVIDTKMNSFLSEDEQSSLISDIPMSRLGEVEEIANMVAFLCSDGCNYLTGQVIKVDGGFI